MAQVINMTIERDQLNDPVSENMKMIMKLVTEVPKELDKVIYNSNILSIGIIVNIYDLSSENINENDRIIGDILNMINGCYNVEMSPCEYMHFIDDMNMKFRNAWEHGITKFKRRYSNAEFAKLLIDKFSMHVIEYINTHNEHMITFIRPYELNSFNITHSSAALLPTE